MGPCGTCIYFITSLWKAFNPELENIKTVFAGYFNGSFVVPIYQKDWASLAHFSPG